MGRKDIFSVPKLSKFHLNPLAFYLLGCYRIAIRISGMINLIDLPCKVIDSNVNMFHY